MCDFYTVGDESNSDRQFHSDFQLDFDGLAICLSGNNLREAATTS